MKHNYLIVLIAIFLIQCKNSEVDRAQQAVTQYLKLKLKRPDSYQPVSYSKLDTLIKPDTVNNKQISIYRITHNYSVLNSDNETVKMSVVFYLDKDMRINDSKLKSINGDYGSLSGNVYWKYNNYVGDKPDAGSSIIVYNLDTIRGKNTVEAKADVQGNYKINKLLPGRYFVMIRSENTTDCPESHIRNFSAFSNGLYNVFDFDINKYNKDVVRIFELDSVYRSILMDNNYKAYGGLSKKISKYVEIKRNVEDMSEDLIRKFPDTFKRKIEFFSPYGNAYDFNYVTIEEGKENSIITDFGITCI